MFDSQAVPARPRAPLSRALVAVNLAVAAGMILTGGSPLEPSSLTLVEWGANIAPLTLTEEPWRLLTSAFVHVGLIHLAFNLWVLWTYGPIVEFLFGRAAFLGVYLAAALFSASASALWNPMVVSADASGALFGLVGAMIGFLGKASRRNPALKSHMGSLLAFVGYNVLFGLIVPGIDNAAHLGGLAAGLMCGWILRPGQRLPRPALLALALLAVGLATLGAVALGRGRVDPVAGRIELAAFAAREGKPEQALEEARTLARNHPDHARARSYAGFMALRQEKWAEAEAQFRAAMALDPELAETRRYLAMALLGQERVAEALPLLEEALRRAPDDKNLAELLREVKRLAGGNASGT